tara:strand:+ start:2285 stop:4537 length:2253 start_codon:yes stop_codon:yes gene_type:complete
VSYSNKQNGIMVNLDYDKPIDDDDIIGWKSDRGWVYLTLLGVRAPKNKMPQQTFEGDVKKIVIDDFDESTQLAILIRKPVVGYDIINSRTSPSTVVFIHTEMKQSEVANLRKHITSEGKSVFNVAKSSGFPKFNTNFRNAFNQAREQLGPNAIFEYNGKLYTTNHPGEPDATSQSVLVNDNLQENAIATKNNLSDIVDDRIYVEKTTGEVFTEVEKQKIKTKNIIDKENNVTKPKVIQEKEDLVEFENKDQEIFADEKIKKKPIGLKSIFSFFRRIRDPEDLEIKTKDNIKNLRNESLTENFNTDSLNLSQNKNRKLQLEYIPKKFQNMELNHTDQEHYIASQTQISDTTFTQELQLKEVPQLQSSLNKDLQKKYIPLPLTKTYDDTIESASQILSMPQSPDTNTVQAWFNDKGIIPEEFNPIYLQKKYIPSPIGTASSDTMESVARSLSVPQSPDTNTVQAWFNDEIIISNEFNPSYLQKQYVPSEKNDFYYQGSEHADSKQSKPQTPEFTAPFVLDNRYKTQFKNNSKIQKSKEEIEVPFEPKDKDNNTWLSFFPSQHDSIKKSLKWNFKEEQEIPIFLHRDKESLNYSSRDNHNYSWQNQVNGKRPKSFPSRYSDPNFRYYHEGAIRVEANMDGVPIYIDGKYIGDTPLRKPVNVEPGWHQVSGFSPVYTHLAKKKGLQYVGYDSIINNNELYGSSTVYAESGKVETVSLKFNQMGDTPKKWIETEGGMSLGLPMFTLLIGLITWAM